ncbi:MAG TPA: ABC transporter permease [Thermoleophilia bacterium]|nr:ABC transporter permease [Thermoleophilia bacterium]
MTAPTLTTEFLKLRRSKVTWLSLLAYATGPSVGALFMWIVRDPERAGQLGLLGTKADLAGLDATWESYFLLLTQISGLGGMILLAVIAAYVFGREYAEGTAKNMLALPVPRYRFALAKLTVVFVWFAGLSVFAIAETVVLGLTLGLSGISAGTVWGGASDVLIAAGVAFLLVPTVAWVATLGRGYLPPMGFAIFTLVLGNVFGATGWGKWFPWSIVPLFAGVAGPRVETLAPASLVVVVLTFLAGVGATFAQMRYADNQQ